MAAIPVELPGLIHSCADGQAEVIVHADTFAGAMEQLCTDYPLLRNALYEPDGTLRQHVLVFFNEENCRWLDSHDVPTKDGDRIIIVQSVAGG